MALAAGTRLGPYEILAPLGAGGMGEVYRARDTRLGRDVAIKVLPALLSRDAEPLRRFEQEARAAATLNHPNILAVFQMGTYEGAPYLVSELLEGGTLREVLARGSLPIRKVIDYGMQVARGLAAAHEKRIVHRDLKPENLFITRDGSVKILDFGLAKLTQRQSTGDSNEPTLTIGTEPGVVMGTVGYMSPEQVSGKRADHRADIFAFGAILYEMLTGKRAFQKPTSAETMSAILNEDPPAISQLVQSIPPALQRIVHRCLEKNPEQRFQSASDLAFALEAQSDSGSASVLGVAQASKRRIYWLVATAVILVVSALAGVLYVTRSARAPTTPTLTRLTWDSGLTTDPALSPDGKLMAYASDRGGEGHLDIYIQQVGGGEPLRLTSGPGDKREPTFSPDATAIAFTSEAGGISLVPTLGGPARKVTANGQRPQFSPDGKLIAFWDGDLSGSCLEIPSVSRIYVVASAGGEPRQLQPNFVAAAYPVWSPDGEHLLFFGNRDNRKPLEETVDWWVTPLSAGPAVKTGALDATRRAKLSGDFQLYPWALLPSVWQIDNGALLFSARYGDTRNLWQLQISPKLFTVIGTPQRLTSGAAREEMPSGARESGGTVRLVLTSVSDSLSIWSLPIDPNQGRVRGELRRLTYQDATGGFHPALSPDGNKMVWVSGRSGAQEIWIRNLKTGEEFALTGTRRAKWLPRFSPDGSKVSFSEIGDIYDSHIYTVPAIGGVPELICEGCGEANGWSPDGKYIIGDTGDGQGWILALASRRRTDIVKTQRRPIVAATFSPDGRWFLIGAGDPFRTYIVPFEKVPAPESTWIELMDSWGVWQWSPDGGLVYTLSGRDGFNCIWARRVDKTTKRPIGEPFAVFHAHNARFALSDLEDLVALGSDKMLFSMRERTGNIWMAEWKQQ